MYNSKFICTYNYYDPSMNHIKSVDGQPVNLEDCADLDDIADTLYKSELLLVFNLQGYDTNIIGTTISELFELLKGHEGMKECMKMVAGLYISEDLEVGFFGLFAYTYMFLTHRCICEFLETGTILDETVNLLKTQIQG